VKRLSILVLCLTLFACASPPKKTWKIDPPHYAGASFDGYESVLKPFPAPHSREQSDDWKQLLDWQNKRTDAECKSAEKERIGSPESFLETLSPPIPPSDLPKILPLLNRIWNDSAYVIHHFKDSYRRDRPYVQRPNDIKPCISISSSPSYPSGHAAQGTAFGEVLADLYPSRAAEMRARAIQYGEHRVMGGVHFPSDVAQGRIIALEMMKRVRANPFYQASLQEIQASLSKN